MRNFPFEHDGQTLWYSRSVVCSVFTYAYDEKHQLCILVNKRGSGCEFNKGLWNIPAGFLDFDETTAQCASRECFEETGLAIPTKYLELIDLEDNPKRSLRQNINIRYRFLFSSTKDLPHLSTAYSEPGEVEKVEWMPLTELEEHKWLKDQISLIRKYQPNTWQKFKMLIMHLLS